MSSSLAGTALGDLFVFGDIRDAVREGSRYASGETADELVLGLACVGIALTAGTYASLRRGDAGARRAVGGEGRAQDRPAQRGRWPTGSAARCARWSTGRRCGAPSVSVAEPAVAVRAAREAVKVEKAGGLIKLVGDVGRVQARAGTKAALDGLKLARRPAEMARVAKLAEKKGGKTRAILKTLGRGAILLSVASFNLALWILGAIADAVRLRVVGQEPASSASPSAISTASKARAAGALCGDGGSAGLNPHAVPGSSISAACRRSTTVPWRSPISTRARASRSCWFTASPPSRR